MDRKRLARRAYNTAVDNVMRAMPLSVERQKKLFRLSCAYEARKSQLDLASFLGMHGLDRVLAAMAAESAAGFVGSTRITQEKAA